MLKRLLTDLRAGEILVLESIELAGGVYALKELSFSGGAWYKRELNCTSSQNVGGTCRCNSHDTYREERVHRSVALAELRAYIARVVVDHKSRDVEIAWLDEAIVAAS